MKFELFGHIVQDKESYEGNLASLKMRYDLLLSDVGNSVSNLRTALLSKNLSIQELKSQLALQKTENELEIKWNTRRHHTENFRYPARTLLNKSDLLKIDPRIFFTVADGSIETIKGGNLDEIAYKCLQWVHRNITYTSDISQFKHKEEWLFSHETLFLKKGDCDDGAILMANMMIRSGIPYWRVRLNAGSVNSGSTESKDINMASSFAGICQKELKVSKKGIRKGVIPTQLQQGLNQVKGSVNLLNLKRAVFLATKEREPLDFLFVNMGGKQLKIDQKFVSNVEQLKRKNYGFTTKIKTEKTILQTIYKYYVILAILDCMGKKGIVDSFLKEISLGTKGLEETGGSSGHCWVTYLSEKNEWLILDWCYNYKTRGQLWRNAEDYFKIWFSFNQKLLFAADMLDR